MYFIMVLLNPPLWQDVPDIDFIFYNDFNQLSIMTGHKQTTVRNIKPLKVVLKLWQHLFTSLVLTDQHILETGLPTLEMETRFHLAAFILSLTVFSGKFNIIIILLLFFFIIIIIVICHLCMMIIVHTESRLRCGKFFQGETKHWKSGTYLGFFFWGGGSPLQKKRRKMIWPRHLVGI